MSKERIYTSYKRNKELLMLCFENEDAACYTNFDCFMEKYNFKKISQVAEFIIGEYKIKQVNNSNMRDISRVLYDISQKYKDIINNKGIPYTFEDITKYVRYLKTIDYRYGDCIPEYDYKKLMKDDEAAEYYIYLDMLQEMLNKRKQNKSLALKTNQI